MKLGLVIGYWNNAGPAGGRRRADQGRRGAWGSTACGRPRPTAPTRSPRWRGGGARPRRSAWAPAITQISARTPASTAMTAITLDHLSDGRLILGLGVSGPQVVEGWYGAAVREAAGPDPGVRRDPPPDLRARGGRLPGQPLPDAARRRAGGTGLGKPLKSIVQAAARRHPHPPRRRGPEERRPGGRDRRRLAADLLLAQVRPATTGPPSPRASPGRGRPPHARGLRGRPAWCPRSSATTSRPAPTCCGRCTRSTSAAWAPATTTSTSTSSAAWATRASATTSRTSTSPAARTRPSPRCRRPWSRTSP